MLRSLTFVALSILAFGCAPSGSDAPLRTRLERHYAEEMRTALAMNGEPLRLDIEFIDLNGDAVPEAIVRLDHPAFCGSRGCAIDVLRVQDGRIAVLGAFIAHKVAIRHDDMTPWRSLRIDGERWIFRDGAYRRSSSSSG